MSVSQHISVSAELMLRLFDEGGGLLYPLLHPLKRAELSPLVLMGVGLLVVLVMALIKVLTSTSASAKSTPSKEMSSPQRSPQRSTPVTLYLSLVVSLSEVSKAKGDTSPGRLTYQAFKQMTLAAFSWALHERPRLPSGVELGAHQAQDNIIFVAEISFTCAQDVAKTILSSSSKSATLGRLRDAQELTLTSLRYGTRALIDRVK